MTLKPDKVISVLGGESTLRQRVRTVDDLRRAVERGLPLEALERTVRRVLGSGAEATALKHSIVPKATLQRRRGRLSLVESERVERLARITALAEEVWEDPASAHEFLVTPQPQLGDERPVDLARTDLGARRVEELLYKLEYSLPA
jgi:putative toxin-antitoxin system antitoxin component (TIGR02293 family)